MRVEQWGCTDQQHLKTGHQFKGGLNEYMNILYLKMLLFPMIFCPWQVEYALEGLVLTEKM